jgi:cupin 2 domain-containing protein
MSLANLFANVPVDTSQEWLDVLVERPGLKIERIVSFGQSSPAQGWYDQAQFEWVILLKGAAIIEFADAATYQLGAGDYLSIPAHQKHRVVWTAPQEETIWLAVHQE